MSEHKEKTSVGAIVGILIFFFIVFFYVAGAVLAMVSGEEQVGERLVVVEVKTRSDDELVAPEEAVDHKKRQSLIWAANDYVLRHNRQEQVRFDIITLVKTGEKTELHHIEDAFNVFCY